MRPPRIRPVWVLLLVALWAVPAFGASAQQTQTKIIDNNYGGKSEVTTDLQGNVVHQKDADANKTVRDEKWVEYGPNQGDTEESLKSYDAAGRLVLTQTITTKGGKRVKGTRTPRVYKDDKDAHGTNGEEMTIDPDTGNWTRPILAAQISLGQADPPNDVSVTYMLKHFPGETYPVGFGVDYSRVVANTEDYCARVVGSYEFYHSSHDNISAYLGGIRFGFHLNPKAMPYAEVTAGAIQWGTTNFLLQYGGGVDLKVSPSKPWELRIGGGLATAFANGQRFNALRLAVGLRYAF